MFFTVSVLTPNPIEESNTDKRLSDLNLDIVDRWINTQEGHKNRRKIIYLFYKGQMKIKRQKESNTWDEELSDYIFSDKSTQMGAKTQVFSTWKMSYEKKKRWCKQDQVLWQTEILMDNSVWTLKYKERSFKK